jgi:DNA-binding transcriptional LysR family regulator
VPLFDRSGKKVTLNESGKRFLGHAMNSIQELDNATSAAQHRDESPMLYLGLFHNSEKFMRCLKDYLESHANVVIQLDHLEITSFSIDTNEYDMLLFPKIPLFRKYRADYIYSDPYFLAVHSGNPLAEKTAVRLIDLAAQKLIFIKRGTNMFDMPYHLCIGSGTHVDCVTFTNNYDMQRWLISNNLGVGFVPLSGAESYTLDPGITLLPVLEDEFNLEIMVGFKREKHLSEIGRQFAAFVRNYFNV